MVLNNITPAMATYMEQGYTYTDEEDSVSKKTEVVYENGIGNYFVKIPKIISLGAEKACKYSVQVKGDIASDKMVYVSPIDSIEDSEAIDFYMVDQSTVNRKQDVTATVNQKKEYWNFKDVADSYIENENLISAPDLSAGTWKGTFNFEINLLNDDGSVIVHDYIGKVLKTATCTENGEKLYTCSDCGQSYTEILPATGHNLVNGVCSLCGTSVQSVSEIEETESYETGTVVSKPENGKLTINGEEVTDDSYTFTEAGTYEVIIETTDPETGDVTVVNKTVTVESHEHDYAEKVLTAPTCVDEGEKELSCSCGSKKYEVLHATGHNVVYGKCTNCGVVVQNTSDLQETEDETISYDKGAVLEVEDDDILKVDGIVVPDNNYTFTEEGEYDVEIETTDPETGEKVVIQKHVTVGTHEHNYSEKVVISPSCLNEGKKELTCSSCGSIKYEVIPATGHEIVDGHCTQCDVVVKGIDDLVNDSGNSEDNITYEAGTVITAPEDGVLTVDGVVIPEGVYTFEEEGTHTITIETTNPETNETETVEVEINIGSHTHNYIENIIKSSTCTEAGEKKLVCSCGSVKYEVIPALGHKVVDDNCTRCGAVIKDASQEESKNVTYYPGTIVTVPEDAVLIVDGIVIPEGSYTFEDEGKHRVEIETVNPETGEKETTKLTVTVAPHEHDYSETILLEANCVEDGEKRLTCECGNSKLVVIPATGHNIVANKCTNCDVTVKKPVNLEKEDNISYENGTVISVPEDAVLKVNGEIIPDGVYIFDEEGTYTVTIESTDANGNPVITEKEVTVSKHEHKYVETITREPSCIETGEKRLSCSCGSVKYEVLSALGHDIKDNSCTRCEVIVKTADNIISDSEETEDNITYEAGTVITAPEDGVLKVDGEIIPEGSYTFEEEGTHTITIETIDEETGETVVTEKEVTITSHKHNYKSEITKVANCVDNGEKVFTCSCGSAKKEVIPATGHNIVNDRCTKCNVITKTEDDFISDIEDVKAEDSVSYESGTVVTVPEDSKLIIDGNVIQEGTYVFEDEGDYKVTIETTNPETGEVTITEKNVTITSHTHKYSDTITKEATCTENGEKKLSCSCGSVKKEIIPALGHEIKDGNCTRCGATIITASDLADKEEATYNEGTVVTVPENGVLKVDGEVIPEGSYTFDEEGTHTVTIETKNPETGKTDVTETEITINAHKHNYMENVLLDANCVEDGKKELSCSCGSVKYEVIPATGHEIVDGSCTRCEVIIVTPEELSTEKEVSYEAGTVIDIPEDGVLKVDGVIVTENPYTFTEEGVHQVVIETANPETGEKERVKSTVTVTSHSHKYSETVTKEATCTEDGEKRLTCTCGSVKYEVLNALGHDYANDFTTDTDATCTETGSKSKHCSRCDSKDEVTVIIAKGHSYDSGVITTQPTCTEKGVKTFTCTVCKFTRTEDVSALGHDYASNFTTDKDATCTETGSKSKHCSRCDSKSEVTVIPAKGHSYANNTPKAWSNSSNETYCFVQNGNVWTSNNAGVDGSTATSTWNVTVNGDVNYTLKYKVSSESSYDKLTITLDSTTIANAISGAGEEKTYTGTLTSGTHTLTAIYSKDGSVNNNDDCGYIVLDDIFSHKCSVCGVEASHSNNSGIITRTPTCTDTGLKTYTCTVCNGTSTETSLALGHNYSSSFTVDIEATCIETGSKSKHCSRCDAKSEVTVIPAKGHSFVNNTCTNCGCDIYDYAPSTAYFNWDYTLDSSAKTITLNYYVGSETDVIVYTYYPVNGTTYTTKLVSNATNAVNSTNYMFNGYTEENCKDIKSIIFSKNIDTSNVINMSYMFYRCESLTSLDVSNFNTSNVTNMQQMFSDCESLTSLDLSNFDTSKVTNMFQMFRYCSSLTSLNVSNFNTSNVTDMNSMFSMCSCLTSLDLSNFNTSKVTNMNQMFYFCSCLTSLDLSNFNTSKVTNMNQMFYCCSSLTSLNVSNFDTNKVTNMFQMFYRCESLTSLDVSNFNTSNVTNMQQMFNKCSSLISLDLSSFDTSKVTEMKFMFYDCPNLKTIYVTSSKWSTSQANTTNMFYNCGTSSVTYK